MKNTFPLKPLTIEEAIQVQFKLVDIIAQHFPNSSFLSNGDIGLVPPTGKPQATKTVEKVIANFFNAEKAILVRGAGTGSIQSALFALTPKTLFVHDAPLYPTTKATCESMGIAIEKSNFNDNKANIEKYNTTSADACLVQLTRQKLDDSYDYEELIKDLKQAKPHRPIITDDNYAVMKVKKIGCECGADASCFSLFKLLGPQGIGCVVGKANIIDSIQKVQYSGGMQVQGHEALDALRSLVYAPVALAIQAKVCNEIAERLNNNEVPEVKNAYVANAQSRVIIVEFSKPCMPDLIEKAALFGASQFPVGAESKYEITPLFYRVSGTFLKSDPEMAKYMLRINPMRAGADTVISILQKALKLMP